ncbi:M14 family metallopeptidase [Psychroserpens sp. MEBiC05023]
MKPTIYQFLSIRILFVLFVLTGCSGVKEVGFKTPVDTNNKTIQYQKKQIYSLNNMGVFASNEFDGARLNGFEKLNDSTVKLIITPENSPINNSAYYAFKVWSNSDKTVYFKFEYPKGFKHRYTPKLKTADGDWYVLSETNVFEEGEDVTVRLNVSKDTTLVCAQQIVTSHDTENWYKNLIKNKTHVQLSQVGNSKQGRPIPVLDIYKGAKKNKPIIVLLTRQHPPEVTGFFAFQSFLSAILNDNQLTDEFLNKYRVLAFPIVNPDGVDLGHWRHNANGVDTNRDWSKYRQPEIKNIVSFITKQSKKYNGTIVLGLDFHSTYEDVFYTNKIRENTTLPHFIEDWFDALESNISGYKVNEAAGNSTKPVSKGWFLYGHNAVGITYEIGDATPKDKIELIGRVSAQQMMRILTKNNY